MTSRTAIAALTFYATCGIGPERQEDLVAIPGCS
jgi:hypothetical protein